MPYVIDRDFCYSFNSECMCLVNNSCICQFTKLKKTLPSFPLYSNQHKILPNGESDDVLGTEVLAVVVLVDLVLQDTGGVTFDPTSRRSLPAAPTDPLTDSLVLLATLRSRVPKI